MSLRPHFNLLRAAFLLLAGVIAVELFATMVAVGGCFWLIVLSQQYKLGACENVTAQIREVWAEMLAAILALLLAGRGGNGKPPNEPPSTT